MDQITAITHAYAFAAERHAGQADDGGVPYLWHVLDVARRARPLGADYEIVAVLHDTVEKTDTSLDEIEAAFGKTIRDGVDAMSKRAGDDFFADYMPRVLANHLARAVKYCDASDNLSGVDAISDPETREKKEAKYRKALAMLEEALPTETVETIRSVYG